MITASEINETLEEIGQGYLEIEIAFEALPGEPMVMYYRDGSGYPGSSPSADLLGVHVVRWGVAYEERERDDHWIWDVLDEIAHGIVDNRWNHYEPQCLEDLSLHCF